MEIVIYTMIQNKNIQAKSNIQHIQIYNICTNYMVLLIKIKLRLKFVAGHALVVKCCKSAKYTCQKLLACCLHNKIERGKTEVCLVISVTSIKFSRMLSGTTI
jgi:hypothetical protein